MKFLIVDDHAMIRRGVKDVLEQEIAGSTVVEAGTGSDALQLVETEIFDVVILDIHLPDKNGLEVLLEIKRRLPHLPVVMLSLHPEDHYAVRAIKVGASSYLTKESAPEELMHAVKKVLQGGKYVSVSLAEKLANNLAGQTPAVPHNRLSNRELEVLHLISRGRTTGEIAAHLCLSVKTISTYRTRILEKLNLHSTPELIRYAIEHHLEI